MEENLTQEESLIKRIVICGPESTGKTTMTNNLAVYFQTNCVDEFARDFLQKKWDSKKEICSKEDVKSTLKEVTFLNLSLSHSICSLLL